MAEFEFVAVSRELCFHFRPVAAELIIERERERESLPIIPRPALFYRGLGGHQLISGSTFRCTSIAISSFFQQMRYIYSWLPSSLYFSLLDFFFFLELQYIYQRLIRIPQASWRDCKQLRFLRGPSPFICFCRN